MLNLLKLKQEKQEQKAAGEGGAAGAPGGKVIPAAQRRVQKDLKCGLEKNSWCIMDFPNADDIMNFNVTLLPDEGFWKGGKFSFSFSIPSDYPHTPPKVLCTTKVFHPNIDLEGKVCLNILRDDWKPVLDISAVINGLFFLFLEPNPSDPLNKDAAELMKDNIAQFKAVVQRSLRGDIPRRY
mmetsp:Transcript_51681/g.134901  ORF Transcript_51681/g.134901 Transcript_51681/m.134901 type:complete len:182 (+) Transcript_51681:24-569(+)